MWDTSTPNDGDVWVNRPSDAQGNLSGRDGWGNPPSDGWGNPTPTDGGSGRDGWGNPPTDGGGGDGGGSLWDLLGGIFGG